MSAPSRAELQLALHELRQAAEKQKSYEPAFVEQLRRVIDARAGLLREASSLPADGKAQCERIAQQCAAVLECIDRAGKYPAHITARAEVLDRSSALGKMIRDLLAKLGPG